MLKEVETKVFSIKK